MRIVDTVGNIILDQCNQDIKTSFNKFLRSPFSEEEADLFLKSQNLDSLKQSNYTNKLRSDV